MMCIWTTTHVTALFPRLHVTGFLICLVKRVPERRRNFVLLVNCIRSLSPGPASREARGEEVLDGDPFPLPGTYLVSHPPSSSSSGVGPKARGFVGERGGRHGGRASAPKKAKQRQHVSQLESQKNRKNETKSTPPPPLASPLGLARRLLPRGEHLQNILQDFLFTRLADVLKRWRKCHIELLGGAEIRRRRFELQTSDSVRGPDRILE